MRLLTLGLAAGTMLATYEPAHACSPPPCWAGFFTPATGTTVPVNVPALYWQPMDDYQPGGGNDIELVTLTTTADPSTPLPFTTTPVPNSMALLITPTEPLVEGMTYQLGDANTCNGFPDYPAAQTSLFLVGPSAPLPTSLGHVSLIPAEVGTLEVMTSSGSCTTDVQGDSAMIGVALATDAQPWKDLLRVETLVDGQPWESSSRVYRVCQSDDPGAATGLPAGMHEISMRATLPGTDLVLTTPVETFQLDCPGDPGDPGDGSAGEDDGGGCAATGTPATLLGLALLGLRRRRRC